MNKCRWIVLLVGLTGCGEATRYRDTSELEQPPAIEITPTSQPVASTVVKESAPKPVIVSLDDSETPPRITLKKLLDRSWELVSEALTRENIEIVDKNREAGIFRVKYDASDDSGEHVGNVHFFWFEDEYAEAEYEIKLSWQETETIIQVRLLKQAEAVDEDEEYSDGSAKLVARLYKAIKAIVEPKETEQ